MIELSRFFDQTGILSVGKSARRQDTYRVQTQSWRVGFFDHALIILKVGV